MIKYSISCPNPLSQFLNITITVTDNLEDKLSLELPAWRPGRYELQHFAQKLRDVSATANGKNIAIQKVTKDRWEVNTSKAETVLINYSFYANQMDGGGSWVDEEQLYINPINCMMAVNSREHEACQLELHIPENWKIACGLSEKTHHVLEALNFDELVDSPLIASASLRKETYKLNDIHFHIWIQGNCKPDWSRIKKDFYSFTKEQLEIFGEFPVHEYHYLNEILPYTFYHGVEHSNSTVITLGPGELLMTSAIYKEFLGISSHELFHTWNIKKIRPIELLPYNFSKENYFKTGYVAEGITTYYGDYVLARAGIFNTAQYFEELNKLLKRYFNDYSRNNLSVADSSFDLWLDGYKPGIPDRKVSIYIKGALTALLLDLKIRKATENQKSLDSVMRALWQQFGKKGIGYSENDYKTLVETIAGSSFESYFSDYIDGIAPIEEALNEVLYFVGCTLEEKENPILFESQYGFKVISETNTNKITSIAPGSPASNKLSIGDELIALNGRKIENNLNSLISLQPDKVELTLFRNKQLHTVDLKLNNQKYYTQYLIQKRNHATAQEKENFEQWLKQKF